MYDTLDHICRFQVLLCPGLGTRIWATCLVLLQFHQFGLIHLNLLSLCILRHWRERRVGQLSDWFCPPAKEQSKYLMKVIQCKYFYFMQTLLYYCIMKEESEWIREREIARDSLFTNSRVQERPVLEPAYHLIRRKCLHYWHRWQWSTAAWPLAMPP